MKVFFSKAKAIEADIDKFLDNISEVAMSFKQGFVEYQNNRLEEFEERSNIVRRIERESDDVRRRIKITLYKELLIPDARGDVLGLIENLDNVIDKAHAVLMQISIEKPIIREEFKDDFLQLAEASSRSSLELVSASRAFFRDISHVADFLNKVHHWEHEADIIEERIKRRAFAEETDIPKFSLRIHVRYFAEKISQLADEAEAVAERLEVYTIKRSI
ncbi:MAG: DUF47 family protein [Spirochaetia bacterium]|nr:DUF47 family protein [Spirochaetia bacterium]